MEIRNADFARDLEGVVLAMPIVRFYGLRFLDIQAGTVEIEMPYRDELAFSPGVFLARRSGYGALRRANALRRRGQGLRGRTRGSHAVRGRDRLHAEFRGRGATVTSFIVPAHNEERLLGGTLTALTLAAQAVGEWFEIVVADDASADRTAAIAREHGATVVAVDCRQISGARNAGAKRARGEMLFFVDADTTVTEPVVRAAIAAMRGGAVGGGCAFRFDGRLPAYGRMLEAVAVPFYRAAGLASGCFLFCTRDAFRAAGGWDETLFAAEELAMTRALRRQGRFVILRESVVTSGRKLRAHSGRAVLGTLVRLAVRGRGSVRRREGLDVWYGERRPDPGDGG
jgi:glycosyl transferase family 2